MEKRKEAEKNWETETESTNPQAIYRIAHAMLVMCPIIEVVVGARLRFLPPSLSFSPPVTLVT